MSAVRGMEQVTAGMQEPTAFPMGQLGKRLLCVFPLTKKVFPHTSESLPLRDLCLGWFL